MKLSSLFLSALVALGEARVFSNGQALSHGQTLKFNAVKQSTPSNFTFYGGPVISNVAVFVVFWGGKSNVQFASGIESFYAGVTNSPYFDWLGEYDTSSQTIGRGRFIGSYSDSDAPTGNVTDSQIKNRLMTLIASKSIPQPTSNTYYAFHFAPAVNVQQDDGSASCIVFCAYHGTVNGDSTTPFYYYGVIPDQGGNCAGGCGKDLNPFNNLCSVSSHELIEAVTDAAVGLAVNLTYPLAWYDETLGEIGDICILLLIKGNGEQGSILGGDGNTYVVQKEWSNREKACIVTRSDQTTTPKISGQWRGR